MLNCNPALSHSGKIATILFVRNEIADISWWLGWNFAIGIDTVIVYDDDSLDGTAQLLRLASEVLDVRCHQSVQHLRFNVRQRLTYMAALDEYREQFDWLLYIDADEYLDIQSGEDVHDFLARYPDADGVAINWCCYGSNGHIGRPSSPNVLDHFTKHSREKLTENKIVKSFFRPAHTRSEYLNPHRFAVTGRYVLPSGKDVVWDSIHPERTKTRPDWKIAKIRHYIIRSAEHYVAKVKRRSDIRDAGVGMGLFQYHDTNDVADPPHDSRYDRMAGYVFKIQNAVARKVLELCKVKAGNEKRLPPARFFEIQTSSGAILRHDRSTGRLIQSYDAARSPEHKTLQCFILDDFPGTIFLVSSKMDTGLYCRGEPRVSTVLSYNLTENEDTSELGLRNPRNYAALSFEPFSLTEIDQGEVSAFNDWLGPWEVVRFSNLSEKPSSLTETAVRIAWQTLNDLPLSEEPESTTGFIADTVMAALATRQDSKIEEWQNLPDSFPIPWMETNWEYSL